MRGGFPGVKADSKVLHLCGSAFQDSMLAAAGEAYNNAGLQAAPQVDCWAKCTKDEVGNMSQQSCTAMMHVQHATYKLPDQCMRPVVEVRCPGLTFQSAKMRHEAHLSLVGKPLAELK